MDYILQTRNLCKSYQKQSVIRDMNMHIRPGDIYGFLGQNGAGKTTTIRMLTGLVKPSSGEIELFGEKIATNSKRHFERIGAIIETPGFYPNLTAYENLDIHRRLMGIAENHTIAEALEISGLSGAANKKVKNFSLGMKQRLGIARALLHHPELLILDEPTNGLDPSGMKEIRQLLSDLAQERNVTILISSHILSEVQKVANRIGIIHEGTMVEEVDLQAIENRTQHYLQVKVDNEKNAAHILEEYGDVEKYRVYEPGVLRIYEKLNEPGFVNRTLVNHGVEVQELYMVKESLEDYFLNLTGGTIDV